MSANPMTTHGAFSWVEHHGRDAAAARSFYAKVLGWTVADMPMQNGTSYAGIMLGEQPIGGFSPKPAESASWLAYVTVDDIDARTRAAVDAGAEVLSEPTSAPGVGRIAVVRDPFGAPTKTGREPLRGRVARYRPPAGVTFLGGGLGAGAGLDRCCQRDASSVSRKRTASSTNGSMSGMKRSRTKRAVKNITSCDDLRLSRYPLKKPRGLSLLITASLPQRMGSRVPHFLALPRSVLGFSS